MILLITARLQGHRHCRSTPERALTSMASELTNCPAVQKSTCHTRPSKKLYLGSTKRTTTSELLFHVLSVVPFVHKTIATLYHAAHIVCHAHAHALFSSSKCACGWRKSDAGGDEKLKINFKWPKGEGESYFEALHHQLVT